MLQNEFYHDLIDSLAAALDAKDMYTAGHSTRVGDMSYKLGECLKLDPLKLQMLHIAAHLHDIGKIGIPDNILNKHGKLTDNEWEIMKNHCTIGYNILSKSKSLSYIVQIVLHHHERYDGHGYPLHKKGSDIPYESRIIAVCDSIDAMKSKRPYKNFVMNDIQCRNELIRNSSIMYDPEVVNCVLINWNHIVCDTYSSSDIQYEQNILKI
ncbi:HD-GYP domain-containing protein [uncultured Clostridium sp.]|uniref:HD-GYP domain-containing protein n=1 Tax=uncultured Clostridium sp. TaxID=59620 RepID=UPI0025E33C52|nr:HD domain-containing phosphohydrolase [uncultured Clostridium sp.]